MSIEQKVAGIWSDVLSASGDTGETFFELGGESIAAVRLVTRIEDELDVLIDVGDIFEDDPTLADLVRTVLAKAGSAAA